MTVQITTQDLAALLDAGAGLKIPAASLTPDTQLATLGIDSLALLGLTAEIERRHQVKLSMDAGGSTSVGEFLRSVNDQLLAAA
ncbi:acyl carrier protein [Planosporangium sp. 12N6]|uniref:acyl carrier protein n=1 Tax=Planosporangium spinosum TaxID=3402278 RepID=UPI003CEF9093